MAQTCPWGIVCYARYRMSETPSNTYLCVHCDHRFTHEGSGKLRCPKCMRKGGLEKVGGEAATQRPRWLLPALIAGALAAIGGGYAYWSSVTPKSVEGPAPVAVLDEATLRAYLRNAKADSEELGAILVASDGVEKFAEESTAQAETVEQKLAAIVEAIRAKAAEQAFVAWSMHAPQPAALRSPAQTLEVLQTPGGRAQLYPIEVATLAAAALRALDIQAMVAEAWAFEGDRQPPDPSGQLGYFIVAAYPERAGEGEPMLGDPFGGRATAPAEKAYRVLSDAQVAAAVLSTDALRLLVRENDTKGANAAVEKALRLDARAPYIRGVRAAVVLASGNIAEGVEELVAAAQIRSDAPRHHNLARVYVAQGDMSQASIEVAAALKEHPDYAAAHATLAAILLQQQEVERARQELEAASRFDPEFHLLSILWAGIHLQQGDVAQAVERAKQAVKRRDYDVQTRLQAAQIFRAAGEYALMRDQARAVLELTPEEQKQPVREQLLAMLGPTVFDENIIEPLDEGDELELPSPDFELGREPGLFGDDEGGLTLGGADPGAGLGGANDGQLRLGGGDSSGGFGAGLGGSDTGLTLGGNE